MILARPLEELELTDECAGDVNPSAVIVVVAEDQGVERLAAERIPADDELLAAIDPHLLPGPRAQARLVPAVAPLRDQSFEPLRDNGGNQVGQRGVEVAEIAWLRTRARRSTRTICVASERAISDDFT